MRLQPLLPDLCDAILLRLVVEYHRRRPPPENSHASPPNLIPVPGSFACSSISASTSSMRSSSSCSCSSLLSLPKRSLSASSPTLFLLSIIGLFTLSMVSPPSVEGGHVSDLRWPFVAIWPDHEKEGAYV